jgi:hypothetical protein
MDFFGVLFEKYIQDLTRAATKNEYTCIDEFEYGPKRKRMKSSDAYVRRGNNLLVVEAKGFSVLSDCMKKNESVEKNNNKLFIRPILQADSCLASAIEIMPNFSGIDNAYIISVTMDNINAIPKYYNEIHAKINQKKKCNKSKYFYNLNIEEYEMLMFLIEKNCDIFNLLKDYYEKIALEPFSTYLLEKHPEIGMTTFMEKCYEEATTEMIKMYKL